MSLIDERDEVSEQQERPRSGAIFTVDVPYWKRKNKRDGSVFSGCSARLTRGIKHVSLMGRNSNGNEQSEDISESCGYFHLHKV